MSRVVGFDRCTVEALNIKTFYGYSIPIIERREKRWFSLKQKQFSDKETITLDDNAN